MKAIWNNTVIAESNNTVIVENNHYFPADSIHEVFFQNSDTQTTCPYKGQASYYHVRVDGSINKDAAWYYPTTKDGFEKIKGRIAFWRGVKIEEG